MLDTVPGGATAEHSEMLADAEVGDGGYDIYNLDNEWVPEFTAGGFIRSLGGLLDQKEFLGGPWKSGSYDGQLYAAPVDSADPLRWHCRAFANSPRNGFSLSATSSLQRKRP